ncbi:unnamed protein product [Ambrosiozyma monospora]|uniref:Unnamed protein product n=1 Tax=Ambrosiozyma monospora TaxID=43982 RepID=A0ACB5STT5_AMBMO|nr:unnamed protein product [Ambrosiozyma monospora]
MSIEIFKQEFSDLCHPQSLLLIRAIIYIGCRSIAKTAEQLDQADLLYERAKLVLTAHMEPSTLYVIMARLMLETPPTAHLNLQSMEDNLSKAVRAAIDIELNKDCDSKNFLSPLEKKMYKRLYYCLLVKDRSMSLSFSKSVIFDVAHSNINPFELSDFDDCGFTPEFQEKVFCGAQRVLRVIKLIDDVTCLQKATNREALNGEPCSKLINKMDQMINKFYEQDMKPIIKNVDSIDEVTTLTVIILALNLKLTVQKVNIFRFQSIVCRCLQSELNNLPYSPKILEEHPESNFFWNGIFESVHDLSRLLAPVLPKFKNQLIFTQNLLFLIIQIPTEGLWLQFHQNKEIRNTIKDDLEKFIPVVKQLRDISSCDLTDASLSILDNIAPVKRNLISYSRMATYAALSEKILINAIQYKRLKPLFKHVSPFLPPVLNMKIVGDKVDVSLGSSMFEVDESLMDEDLTADELAEIDKRFSANLALFTTGSVTSTKFSMESFLHRSSSGKSGGSHDLKTNNNSTTDDEKNNTFKKESEHNGNQMPVSPFAMLAQPHLPNGPAGNGGTGSPFPVTLAAANSRRNSIGYSGFRSRRNVSFTADGFTGSPGNMATHKE